MRDERPWSAAAAGEQRGGMEPEDTIAGQAAGSIAEPARRLVVVLAEPPDGGSACRIEDPERLLRVWSLLQATAELLDWAALSPEDMPRLQRQSQAIRRELETAVSASLAAELRRILPSQDAAPSAGALRIEYAALLSWSGSLVVQMLRSLAAAHERLARPSAA
jgi:hypothetical protein